MSGVRKSARQRKVPTKHGEEPSTSLAASDEPLPSDWYTLDKLISEARKTTILEWHPVINADDKEISWIQRSSNTPKSHTIREVKVKQLGDLLVPSVSFPTGEEPELSHRDIKRLLEKDTISITSWEDIIKLTDYARATEDDRVTERAAEEPTTEKKKRKRPKKKKKWDDGEYPCEFCGEVFTRIHWMYRHVSMFHPDQAQPDKYAIQSLFQPIYPTYIPTEEERKRFLKRLKEAKRDTESGSKKSKKRLGREKEKPGKKGKSGIKKKKKSTGGTVKLYCEDCDRHFSAQKWLDNHMEKEHDGGNYRPSVEPTTSNGITKKPSGRKPSTSQNDHGADEASGSAEVPTTVTFRRLLAQLEWTIEAFRRKRSMKDAVQSTSLHISELGLPEVSGAWCLRVIPYSEPGWTSVHLVLKEPQEEGTQVHLMHFAIDILDRANVARRVFNFEKPANEECLPPSNYGVGERDWGVKKTLYHGDLFSKDESSLVDGALHMRAEIDFVVERKERVAKLESDAGGETQTRKRGRKQKV